MSTIIGRLSGANGKCSRLSFLSWKRTCRWYVFFMLTQALTMGVTDGRQTTRPLETPTDDIHEPVARRMRACPSSWLSDTSRPVVVRHQKRPNHGQRRVPLRSGWTPSLHVTWGNGSAERYVKTPRVKSGRWARCLKINNSSGIEFSVHAPLSYFTA